MRAVARFLLISLAAIGLAVVPGVLPSPITSEDAHATSIVMGDVDCDTAVTAADAATALRVMAGLADGCEDAAPDVNCSGGLDIGDAVLLRLHVAGLSDQSAAGCPAIGTEFSPSGPTSTERIEEALASGDITRGQAILYHLYSELEPDRLPVQFRGPAGDHSHVESTLFHEAASAWNTLSASEQEALMPYLLPPADPGSWMAGAEVGLRSTVEWATVSNSRIKVWWQTRRPEDEAKAQAILDELDGAIWPDLVNYMGVGHAPIPDAGYKGNGGDGRYDVYLVHNAPSQPGEKPVLGWVSPMAKGDGSIACKVTPTYMVLNSRAPLSDVFFSTVAHEFMHSVQFTYDVGSCDDYRWLMESTATWVESWLYPEVNQEHGFATTYLNQLDTKPLEHWAYKDERQYGSYLFWYHAQHNEGLANAVRDVWLASGHEDSLVAVDLAVRPAGGIEKVWPESALYNWNREPYEDFTAHDGLFAAAPWNDVDVKAGATSTSYAVPTDVGHMQQRHLNFSIDPSVRRLTFINPFAANYDPAAKVQALLQVSGSWQPVALDWTNEERLSFCFDKPNENITQLVIIITNSNFSDRTHVLDAGPGELIATPSGCKGWVGSASATIQYFDTTFHITVDNLRFAPDEENPGNEKYDFYELVEAGTATWTVSGSWFETCTPSGTMTLKPPKEDPTSIAGFFHVDKENNTYNVNVNGNTYEDTLVISCPNSDPWTRSWPVSQVLFDGAVFRPIPENGVISQGYSEDDDPDHAAQWQWSFTEVK